MISGFVILMTAANGSFLGFAVSRVVRLYPAFWVCCTITFLFTVFLGGERYSATLGQYLVNMTMLSDFLGVEPIDGVYWSLFVEIRFYILVALVLIIGRIHQVQALLVVWLLASAALEFFPVGKLIYWLVFDYSAFFIAGAACFLIWSDGPSVARLLIVAFSWTLAVFQSVSALPDFERKYGVAMSSYVVSGVVTAFFAVMILISLRRTGIFGRVRWIAVGAITYPLYLLHQNIGFMVFNAAYPAVGVHVLFWGVLVAAILSAYLVHLVFERRLSMKIKIGLNRLAGSRFKRSTCPAAR